MRITLALLLGAWLMGTLLLAGVASENFFIIDRLLNSSASSSFSSHPAFQKDVAQLPPGEARITLRYVSSEMNRLYFVVWGWIELVIAVLVLALAMESVRRMKFTIVFSLMLLAVAVMVFYITPEITQVGRALDYVPRDPKPPELAHFGMLHGLYSVLDLLKLVLGFWMAAALVRLPPVE